MEEIYITEEELEYFTDVPTVVCEETVHYRPHKLQASFEEESKDCITLEEFSRMWDESIRRLIPNP